MIHFSMNSATQCAPAQVIDWNTVRAFAREEIVQCLQATDLREE
jgi:hypothetical protein